jgi:hypothetical protein
MHRQVQERVGTAFLYLAHAGQGGVYIGKVLGVFRVFVHPTGCYYFYSFQCSAGEGFGINRAKKTADIGL